MLKKAFMLVSGNAFASVLLLLRNLIVARMVSPEDYGIASTFAISMSIVEMVSYLGLQQLIVVDKDGDQPHVQKAMQGFQVMRGIFTSLLLFSIAHPYAQFLDIPHVAWAYQVLALVPFINGLQHYDIHRLKRHLNFTPSIVSSVVPALLTLLAIWPIATIYGDFRLMLASLILQAVLTVALSHMTAERRYGLAYDSQIIRKAMVFGWPLLLNGIMLFAVFNGEKLIVGRELGMASLAIFSMAYTLTLTPTLVLANSIQQFFLPQLGAVQDRQADFQRIGMVTIEAGLCVGLILVLGIVILGGPVVSLLLGPKYETILHILVPLAILQAVRSAKTGSSVVALARKRSGNALVANLFRVASLPIAWWVAVKTGDIIAILWVGVAAEIVGFLVSLWLVRSRVKMSLYPLLIPVTLAALAYITTVVVATLHPPAATWERHLRIELLLPVGLSIAAMLSMEGLRDYAVRRFARRWRRA